MDARNRSLFISSCTRRELARRRPARSAVRIHLLGTAILVAVAVGAFVAASGGL
jgi:hypothetical protein